MGSGAEHFFKDRDANILGASLGDDNFGVGPELYNQIDVMNITK